MENKIQFFTAVSGTLSARVLFENGACRHLHSTVKPEDESKYFNNMELWGDVIILCGTGLGYHLQNKLPHEKPEATFILIDHFRECLNHCLKNFFSSAGNTLYTVSPETSPADLNRIKNLISANTSSIQIINHPASYHISPAFYQDKLKQLIDRRPQKNKVNRKAILLYGSYFLQEEIKRALEKKGVETILLHYNNYGNDFDFGQALQGAIQKNKPDFILSVNMKGFDGEGVLAENTERWGIPCAVWFVDDPHTILLHQKQYINPLMRAYCWERAYHPYLEKCGFRTPVYLPLASDPAMFHNPAQVKTAYKLGFIGSALGSTFRNKMREKFLWQPELEMVADTAADLLMRSPKVSPLIHMRQACRKMETTLPFSDTRNISWFIAYIINTATMKKRVDLIGSLTPLGIDIFSDEQEWKELLGEKIKTHPDIDYRKDLCNAYSSIELNVNITSSQMPTTVNQRVFDVPLSGSFVISDKQDDLLEMFDPEKEIAFYSTRDELIEKVKYYAARPLEAKAITAAATKRILDQHTYEHRIDVILKTLF